MTSAQSSISNKQSSFLTYQNSKLGYRIQHPSDLEVNDDEINDERSGHIVIFGDVRKPIALSVMTLFTRGIMDGHTMAIGRINDMKDNGNYEKFVHLDSRATYLGWYRAYILTYEFRFKHTSTTLKAMEIIVPIKNKLFDIIYTAPKSDCYYNLPKINKMIDSFHILSPSEINLTRNNF
jgi:hypothetical protein